MCRGVDGDVVDDVATKFGVDGCVERQLLVWVEIAGDAAQWVRFVAVCALRCFDVHELVARWF